MAATDARIDVYIGKSRNWKYEKK